MLCHWKIWVIFMLYLPRHALKFHEKLSRDSLIFKFLSLNNSSKFRDRDQILIGNQLKSLIMPVGNMGCSWTYVAVYKTLN